MERIDIHMKKFLRRAWAEVHLDRLRGNLTALRSLIDENTTQIACVVKANAYGHDDGNIAPFLESLGVSFFAVSNIKEAENLRKNGVKGEILILGHTPAEYAAGAVPTDSNIRGSAAYRTHLIRVLTERAALELGGM